MSSCDVESSYIGEIVPESSCARRICCMGHWVKRRWDDRSSRENLIEEGDVSTQKVLKKAPVEAVLVYTFIFIKCILLGSNCIIPSYTMKKKEILLI